ncbi:tol-pal system protein YbgF [bacterium]|nr:tol-pal system protein YbgF [bacterium]
MIKKVIIVLVGVFFSGCATMNEYKSIPPRVKKLEDKLNDLQKNYAGMNARIDELNISAQIIDGKVEENHYNMSDVSGRLDAIESNLGQRLFLLEEKAGFSAIQSYPSSSSSTTPAQKQNIPKSKNKQSFKRSKSSPRQLYQAAYDDYVKRNYALALTGFQQYLKQYPQGELSSGSQYWVGECYYSQGDFKNAASEFGKVIARYPKSNKLLAAKLKKAYSLVQLDKRKEAIALFGEIIDQSPLSTEAKLSKRKKAELEKEE